MATVCRCTHARRASVDDRAVADPSLLQRGRPPAGDAGHAPRPSVPGIRRRRDPGRRRRINRCHRRGAKAAAAGDAVSGASRPANHGKGFAVRTGMLAAAGELLVFTDADGAYGPESVARVVRALATHPVAIGARGRHATAPLVRRVASRTFNQALQSSPTCLCRHLVRPQGLPPSRHTRAVRSREG